MSALIDPNLFPEFPSTNGRESAFEREWRRLNEYHGLHVGRGPESIPESLQGSVNEWGLADETDSPIEYHMQRALMLGGAMDREGAVPLVLRKGESPRQESRVQIIPQLKVNIWRVDLAVCWWSYGSFARVAIECDGRDFHAITPEQVERDKRRDRDLMQYGWPVLRFSGSEIAENVFRCAKEVEAALRGLQWDVVCAYRAGLAALHRKERGLK
ncbi:MAG: hypothetical protein CML03_00405 [Pseudooceanicola sp.]|jgi:very-short-patch-repair endonuclease|nr:hypothetical protein [Pseudooceanicola sp.]|tara:strand:+ start:355 stop:996 length:642 start_codon:yes stop_codon:yes gene_type:complete